MGVDGAAIEDRERLRRHRLDAEVIGSRGDGRLDPGGEQAVEHLEEEVLQIDPQGQDAVEELGDRRQVLADRAVLSD